MAGSTIGDLADDVRYNICYLLSDWCCQVAASTIGDLSSGNGVGGGVLDSGEGIFLDIYLATTLFGYITGIFPGYTYYEFC